MSGASGDVLRRLEKTPRFPLLCGPTPLHRMEPLEQALGCGPLYIKRDDLTPLGLGGNKARKLEFLVADALARGANTLVTVGGVQTNHGRLTAAAAAKAGLACTLVLEGSRPEVPSGNLLLDCLLGASLVYTDGQPVQDIVDHALKRLTDAGKKPYFIPEGGSNAVGSAGYLALVPELMRQLAPLPEPPARRRSRASSAPPMGSTSPPTRPSWTSSTPGMGTTTRARATMSPTKKHARRCGCSRARRAFFSTPVIRPRRSAASATPRGSAGAARFSCTPAARPPCGRRSISAPLRRSCGKADIN